MRSKTIDYSFSWSGSHTDARFTDENGTAGTEEGHYRQSPAATKPAQ